MNTWTILIASILLGSAAIGNEPKLPPPEMDLKEEWTTLEKKNYSNWKIEEFVRWGSGADGGSIAFDFLTTNGIKFDVLVANPAYWTAEDKEKKRQVIYLIESGRFYLLKSGSEHEKHLLKMLKQIFQNLKDDGDISRPIMKALVDTIETRKTVTNEWPTEHTSP